MPEQKTAEPTRDTLFKPAPSRMEARNITTDKAARAIIDSEKTATDAKTRRLREARLERERSEQRSVRS